MTVIDTACARIAPLFPLDHFVAVNPYYGLAGMEFAEAAQYLTAVAPGSLLPGAPPQTARLHTVADWLDRTQNTSWNTVITEEISKWCSSFYDQGQSLWSLADRERGLYFAWKRAAAPGKPNARLPNAKPAQRKKERRRRSFGPTQPGREGTPTWCVESASVQPRW